MKRALPYIIVLVLLVLLGALMVSGNKNRPRKLDERITLKKEDKKGSQAVSAPPIP